jgi:hypothetical protein
MILRALVAAGRVHLRNTLARPLFQVMIVVQPVAMVLLTHYVYGGEGAARTSFFVVLGSGLAGMWMATAFSSAGDLGRERGYGMVNTGAESAGSQFFVTLAPARHLDGAYCPFGVVLPGTSTDVVDALAQATDTPYLSTVEVRAR